MGHGSHGGISKARQNGKFKSRNGKNEESKLSRSQRMRARKGGEQPRNNPAITPHRHAS